MQKLSKKEKELVVSCLLGFASGDICLDDLPYSKLVKIAKKFEVEKVKTAYIFDGGELDNEKLTNKIKNDFNIKTRIK